MRSPSCLVATNHEHNHNQLDHEDDDHPESRLPPSHVLASKTKRNQVRLSAVQLPDEVAFQASEAGLFDIKLDAQPTHRVPQLLESPESSRLGHDPRLSLQVDT